MLSSNRIHASLLLPLITAAAAACAPTPRAATPDAATIAERVPDAWAYPLHPPTATAPDAMVTSDAPLATDVGLEVLRAGGNAIDAAIATAFALAVVYPEAGNIGGGGFMVVRMADGETAALDFREKAPLAATRDMFLDEAGEPTDASWTGYLASGVPGSVMGLWEAHRHFGSRPWAELVAPAIRLAADGFVVDEALEESIRDEAETLRLFESSRELYLSGGEPPATGTVWRNPDLAATLRRIAENGAAGFYEGRTAELTAAEMRRGGGLITVEDLARYEAEWREPIRFDYRGHEVISMPPSSSGGITLALIARVLEHWDLASLGWHSPDHLHVLTEAMRLAFADRNHYLGDPDFVTIPRERLLSDAYAERRAASIRLDRATPSAAVEPGLGIAESDHTTHFAIVDPAGNAVSLTTTINGLYGSGVVVGGAGFVLNNEMDDFTSKPGEPNAYGLVQGEANAIVPEKRMLSAMTPTIVVGPDGRVLLVTGARGGPRIITGVFQVLSNVVDFGMDIGTAVNAPRIHHQHLPDVLYYERQGLTEEQIAALRARGHDVRERDGYIGSAPSILARDDGWRALADPRTAGLEAHGAAVGF
ncbi:MAG: gamma-glutamyltransferase [Longimicrobiales bacterium]